MTAESELEKAQIIGEYYTSKVSTDDPVNHPAHYTDGKIEVWDFIEDKGLNYFLGNVVKYVCRAGKKSPDKHLEDLKKAQAYLTKEIANREAWTRGEGW